MRSTIVEIIGAYQPCWRCKGKYSYLQQQKLLEHTSLFLLIIDNDHIYNSRNYWSILAIISDQIFRFHLQQQKLLEHTSHSRIKIGTLRSTIVEIIGAYQPVNLLVDLPSHLQQQKLLEHTSRVVVGGVVARSTIVEIIGAYQPLKASKTASSAIYNSRNYWSILAFTHFQGFGAVIYNSRNYWSILACSWTCVVPGSVSTIVEIIGAYQPTSSII